MVDPTPLVSVVIPAYNAERFLGEALASVRAQSYERLEIIVCDDASTDGTADIVRATRDERIRYLRNDATLGGYGAMNRGVRESHGEYTAIYHADDVYDSRIVERELAFLRAHAGVGAVFCLDRFIDETAHEYARLRLPRSVASIEMLDAGLLTENLLRHKNTFLRTPSVMFRRLAFDAIGGFDQQGFGIAADLDMWLRLSLEWRIGLIHDYLMGYRHYAAQWSKQYEQMRTEPEMFFAVMDRHLSRPGVRDLASRDALACYHAWRAHDDIERAANAYALGNEDEAGLLLAGVRPWSVLRSPPRVRAARVLALHALVRLVAATGLGPLGRRLVHVARFRRWPPADLGRSARSVTHSLGEQPGSGSPPFERPTAE